MSATGPASDADLLGRLGDDPSAFEQFYRRHFDAVTRFLARRCRTPEDVADATSATFLAVLKSVSTYDPCSGRAVPLHGPAPTDPQQTVTKPTVTQRRSADHERPAPPYRLS
ncbi:MAG: RNA polymerase sigma factor [Acidimicrobiales bacterium]